MVAHNPLNADATMSLVADADSPCLDAVLEVQCDVLPGHRASVKDKWSGLNFCNNVSEILAKHNPGETYFSKGASAPSAHSYGTTLREAAPPRIAQSYEEIPYYVSEEDKQEAIEEAAQRVRTIREAIFSDSTEASSTLQQRQVCSWALVAASTAPRLEAVRVRIDNHTTRRPI